MAAIPLFRDTNMAAATSYENILLAMEFSFTNFLYELEKLLKLKVTSLWCSLLTSFHHFLSFMIVLFFFVLISSLTQKLLLLRL